MGRLNKDAWKQSSLRTKEVEVEELGGSVLIRELPASISADLKGLLDVVQVGQEQRAKIDVAKMERRQFAYGVVDDNGNPLFTEEEVADLQAKHGRAFATVVDAIDKFSGIDKEAIAEAEVRFPIGGNGTEAERQAGSDLPAASGRPDHETSAGTGAGDDRR